MVQYRRSQTPGGTYFFTVNLPDRSCQYLITYIDDLRKAFHNVRNGLLKENWRGQVAVGEDGYGENDPGLRFTSPRLLC